MEEPTNSREDVLLLFLAAFEAWGIKRDLDRAFNLAKEAAKAAADMDDDVGRRVRLAVTPFRTPLRRQVAKPSRPQSSRETALLLFLGAFEAWNHQSNADRAIELADRAFKKGVELGDDEVGRRVREAAVFLQGMAAPFASVGASVRGAN